MALANPLGIASFADLLETATCVFRPMWMQESSGTGGGELLYADRAPMRWQVEVTTAPMSNADAMAIMALVNSRGGGLKTFLLYDKRAAYPSTDPTGSIFGSATPEIGTITDRLHIAFTGFPAAYVVPLGTYFSVVDGDGRRYLGQFAEAKTADGSGAISATEITPALPAAFATADAVTVIKPTAKFKIVPNSAYAPATTLTEATVTFQAESTYEADPA